MQAPVKNQGIPESADNQTARDSTALAAALRETERRLHTTETLLGAVTAHSLDWLVLVDRELRVSYVNRTIAGVAPENAIGSSVFALVRSEEHAIVREGLERAFAEATIQRGLLTYAAEGSSELRVFEALVAPVIVDGVVRQCSVSLREVTERERAVAALHESLAVLRIVADNAADLFAVFDARLVCTFASREIAGRSPAMAVGMALIDCVPLQHRAATIAAANDVLTSGAERDLEYYLEDPRIGRRIFEVHMRPLHGAGGIDGLALLSSEVTERRVQRDMLRIQTRVLNTLHEVVVMLDDEGTICFCNRAFDQLFAAAEGGLLGAPAANVLPMDSIRRGAAQSDAAQVAAGAILPFEIECRDRAGQSVAMICTVRAVSLGAHSYTLIVLADVTERRALEREILEIANREQRRIGSDLHDGLGQDLTGISLLLSGIAGRMAKRGDDAADELREVITLVNSTIQSARALARGLSPISSERGGLNGALQSLRNAPGGRTGVTIEVQTPDDGLPKLSEGAATHLYRIAQEAVTNALRHGKPRKVSVRLDHNRAQLTLEVQNDGDAFPAPADRGDGLGLRIMRYRAQMLHGDLLVENMAGGGVIVRCQCLCQ
ncbi:MAG: PAS domain-containing protein [Steroidobacteraceae bacterium]